MKPIIMHRIKKKGMDSIERIAMRATRFIGSTESLIFHTILFIVAFMLYFWGIPFDKILLVVTTIVSLEAIYLSIFIQMSVNRQGRRLHAVARDVEEIGEDVEEIQKDVDEIQEDVEGIEKDVDEIQKDVEDLEVDEKEEELEEKKNEDMMVRIEDTLGKLIEEVMELKKQQNDKNKK